MSEQNSPYYKAGLGDGAADAARNPRVRRGYDPAKAHSWMYRRGFARAFLAVRAAVAVAPGSVLDDRPVIIAAMQRGLDDAWSSLVTWPAEGKVSLWAAWRAGRAPHGSGS